MNKIPDSIINRQSALVSRPFKQWRDVLYSEVEFWPLQGEFDIHTQGHCERVLMLALKLGEARAVSPRQQLALCHASIMHDSRRLDNYLDTGHGDRAAQYYTEWCKLQGIDLLPEAYIAIKFHDRNDSLGEAYIASHASDEAQAAKWQEVYRDFKDADALDRLRLGPWALDDKYLRSQQAVSLKPFAQQLIDATIDAETMKRITNATRPYANRFSPRNLDSSE